jgi:two-component system sensor histidine kinase VicK
VTVGHAPLRVLIADNDEAFVRFFIHRMESLKEWAVTVDACGSGADLTQRIYAQPYDLVFMDLGLPDFDGLSLLTRVAQTSLPLPFVVFSEKNEARPAVEAMKRGVLDHVMKEDFSTMDLDGFLGRLTETFHLKRENAELHQIGEMKNDFLATISHELRTPLTSILGLSELVLTGRMGPLNEKQADSLRKVIEQSQNLARLINQLLDVQDTLRTRSLSDLHPLLLNNIVGDRASALTPLFEKKKISLVFSNDAEGAWIRIQEDAIAKVVDHLLLNALKFTSAGGRVAVAVTPLGSGGVLATVRDDGQGIPKEALPFVFQKFFHADPSLNRGYGGLGLGLAYCQYVVESAGGRIWVESAGPNQGTTVSFTLPRLDPSEAVPAAVSRDHQVVLWVDDNVNMLELMEVGFASLPETVQLVTRQSGQAALDEAFAHPPDLIVLDIMMPDMNGLEVLARLQQEPSTRAIPVLIVTGYKEAAEEAVARGATAYFLKPFRIPDILAKVREFLKISPTPVNS